MKSFKHRDPFGPRAYGSSPNIWPNYLDRRGKTCCIERDLESVRNSGLSTVPQQSTRISSPAPAPAVAPRITSLGIATPTLLHLFDFWQGKQTIHCSIRLVSNSVLEFHAVHGPMRVEDIARQHARQFRDHQIEKHLPDSTIENLPALLLN